MKRRHVLYTAFAIFTLLTCFYCLVILALYTPEEGYYISAMTVFMFLPFSFSLSCANLIFNFNKLHPFAKVCLHGLTYLISFFVFILMPLGQSITGSSRLVICVIVTLLYVLVAALVSIVRSSKKKKLEKREAHALFNRK